MLQGPPEANKRAPGSMLGAIWAPKMIPVGPLFIVSHASLFVTCSAKVRVRSESSFLSFRVVREKRTHAEFPQTA